MKPLVEHATICTQEIINMFYGVRDRWNYTAFCHMEKHVDDIIM
jgi:hypothetical protein